METQTIEPVQATRAADPATVAAYAGAAAFVIAAGWFWLATMAASYPRDAGARSRRLTRIGALLVGAGAATWITGSILQLGGHRAVGLMATHTNPIQTTNSIAFTIDMIVAAFALVAFALIGAGMLAFAAAVAREHPSHPGHRAWAGYTIVLAVTLLALAWSYAAGNGNLSDLMLIADGIVLLPLWLIWTIRIRRITTNPRAA